MNKRLRFLWHIVRPLVITFTWLKFGYRFKTAKNLPENYIVLSNHTTDFDPLFVGTSFPTQMYFVCSEHLSRWKNAFKFIKFIFDPIIRPKGSLASFTVREVLRKTRAGQNVCIFAEGGRSWDGVTAKILPSTGKMIKSARCGLVTYKIVGGYFTSPNWSESNTRRGPICGAPVNVYTKEQLEEMSVDEINEIIARDLYEDAYERQLKDPKKYSGKRIAEKMENMLFICPECGALDSIVSHNDTVSCKNCNMSFKYTAYGMLEGCKFKTVKELYSWQIEHARELASEKAVLYSPSATLSSVGNQKSELVACGEVSLSQDELTCGDFKAAISDISELSMHGRRAIVFTAGKNYYELVLPSGSNAYKYVLAYELYKENSVPTEN